MSEVTAVVDMTGPGSGGASVPDGVLRQEFMATLGRLDKLDTKIDQLVTASQAQQVSLVELRGAIMSRTEIEAALEKRVSVELFAATIAAATKQRDEDLRDIEQRFLRLEAGPQRVLSWLGFALSMLAFLITASYFVVWLAQHASK